MSDYEKDHKSHREQRWNGIVFAAPFLSVMLIVAVIACILPLRPTVSYREKRVLKEFPELTMESFWDGSFFEDVSLWYSDTFPGREGWLDLSQNLNGMHGYGSISIQGDLPENNDPMPSIPTPTKPTESVQLAAAPETEPTQEETVSAFLPEPETTAAPTETAAAPETTAPAETEATAPPTTAATQPPETEPAATQETTPVLLDEIIDNSSVIQIRDSAYNPVGFSQQQSDRYAQIVSKYAEVVAEHGTRVISAPPPTSMGIMVDEALLPQLRSTPQRDTLAYMHGSMADNVITVDTVGALLPHKNEYLYFHSDHHWTALAAYYAYAEVCRTLGMTPVALEACSVIDEGEFQGSLYGKVLHPNDLAKDTVYAYVPPGNIYMKIWDGGSSEYDGEMIRDLSDANLNAKYLAFLESDRAMVRVCNEDLPDAGNCLIIKDSFGNCFVPWFSQNYHNVYAIDYRKFSGCTLTYFVTKYDIQDVIFAPNIMATQSSLGENMLASQCNFHF